MAAAALAASMLFPSHSGAQEAQSRIRAHLQESAQTSNSFVQSDNYIFENYALQFVRQYEKGNRQDSWKIKGNKKGEELDVILRNGDNYRPKVYIKDGISREDIKYTVEVKSNINANIDRNYAITSNSVSYYDNESGAGSLNLAAIDALAKSIDTSKIRYTRNVQRVEGTNGILIGNNEIAAVTLIKVDPKKPEYYSNRRVDSFVTIDVYDSYDAHLNDRPVITRSYVKTTDGLTIPFAGSKSKT